MIDGYFVLQFGSIEDVAIEFSRRIFVVGIQNKAHNGTDIQFCLINRVAQNPIFIQLELSFATHFNNSVLVGLTFVIDLFHNA